MRTLSPSFEPISFDESLKRGVLRGFAPHRLEIEGRPELNNFPLNVLFERFGIRNGEEVAGYALYEPDFPSFRKEGEEYSMIYRDIYGGNCYLVITYRETDGSYTGEKFIDGKSVGLADGRGDWDMFFFHFTALGIFHGERCYFEKVERTAPDLKKEKSRELKVKIVNLVLRTLRWMPFGS